MPCVGVYLVKVDVFGSGNIYDSACDVANRKELLLVSRKAEEP